jgi:hypothetical protein
MRHLTIVLFCGWVLWLETGQLFDLASKHVRWTIVESYESLAECKRDMKDAVSSKKTEVSGKGEAAIDAGRGLLLMGKHEVGESFLHYYCLPGEVDPRPRG